MLRPRRSNSYCLTYPVLRVRPHSLGPPGGTQGGAGAGAGEGGDWALQLPTGLREFSQCQEKAPTMNCHNEDL